MMINKAKNETISNVYRDILGGDDITTRGQLVKEQTNKSLVFDNREWFIDSDHLPLNLNYVKEELRWYRQGNRDSTWIANHAKIWKNCISCYGRLHSNYGYYFNEARARIYRQLKHDPNTRQAVININRPEHHYPGNKDVPCTMHMQFMIRDNSLHLYVSMRSQDAVFGLRNDLPAFQMFKLAMSSMLHIEPGPLFLHVNSFHVYERHFDKLWKAFSHHTSPFYFMKTGDFFDFVSYHSFISWLGFAPWMEKTHE